MLNNGEGVPLNHVEAEKYYRKSAEQGHAMAQYGLATIYEYGNGVNQDYREAFYWYTKSAKQGHPNAQLNLGSMYLHGEGVGVDYEKAYELFRKSALQGEPLAIFNIGQMYTAGAAVQKSNVMALAHYQIAKANTEDSDIASSYGTLKSHMSSAEIQAAEQEARKLMREYGLE
jgi:TPR repeat protein